MKWLQSSNTFTLVSCDVYSNKKNVHFKVSGLLKCRYLYVLKIVLRTGFLLLLMLSCIIDSNTFWENLQANEFMSHICRNWNVCIPFELLGMSPFPHIYDTRKGGKIYRPFHKGNEIVFFCLLSPVWHHTGIQKAEWLQHAHIYVLRQHLPCIQYKIAVVYSFGNKKWQQLSVSSHNQQYLQERNNDGSLDELQRFQQVQTITSNVFHTVVFLPRCAFSPHFWTLKRVHFNFLSAFILFKKAFSPLFHDWKCFLLT